MRNTVTNFQEAEEDGVREVFSNEDQRVSNRPWHISSAAASSSSNKVSPSTKKPQDQPRLANSKTQGMIAVVVCVCLAWTLWLILLNIAPNHTVNRIMDTETFDYGSFWLFAEPPRVLGVLAPLGLSSVAVGYVAVLAKIAFYPDNPMNRPRSNRKVKILQKMESSFNEAAVNARNASKGGMSSATVQLALSLSQADSATGKRFRLGMKMSDLALEVLLLNQLLESGSPVVLVAIFTAIVVMNALSCALMMFVPYERAPLTEIVVDILFDFLVIVGFQALQVIYCLSTFTFDRAKLAINLEVFPPGWFEQDASVIADPVETAIIYQTLKTLRVMSVLGLLTRIGVNISICYRFWQIVSVVQDRKKQRSSVYPKRNRPAALVLVIFAVFVVIFVKESLRTSTLACKPHPECAVNARRWTVIKSDSLAQCPCLILIDRDITPKTYAEWLNPKNVTDKVIQLAATGDLQTLQLTNRYLPELPEELHRCKNLRHLSLEYTHTQTFPPWAKDFTQLEFLHVESKFFSPMVYMPDDLFDKMSSVTFIHFGAFIPMAKLPSFDGLTNLKSLTLAVFLVLEELPAFDSLHKLERLVLVSLPGISTLPDFGPIENLQSFSAFDRGTWCCNGFLGDCDLSDGNCGAHPVWKTPAATCVSSDNKATVATVDAAHTFNYSICGPVLQLEAVQGTPTEETMAVCKGTMYRQCNKPNEPEAMCYNVRFMGITCTPNPYAVEMRRRQIAQSVGDPCDPDIEAWLGCKMARR